MPNIEVLDGRSLTVHGLPQDEQAPELELVNPLEIRFSQNVVNPTFSDGRSVDEAVRQLTAHLASAGTGERGDLSEHVVLEPPFPPMEAVHWCPKLRDGNGKPLLDEFGNPRHGKEGLFSVDNRRLYVLQRAAVAYYPRRVRVGVILITEKLEMMKHIKKFRTRTNGLSITVSEWNGVGRNNAREYSAMRVWDWRSAVSRVQDESDPLAKEAAAEAAQKGSCGCWEYLDGKDIRRGPFSNWQMRQWWERRMLPLSLRIRPYSAVATSPSGGAEAEEDIADFQLATLVFENAPAPFAAGWSPRATDGAIQARKCSRCNRKRFNGTEVDGSWLCQQCFKRRAANAAAERVAAGPIGAPSWMSSPSQDPAAPEEEEHANDAQGAAVPSSASSWMPSLSQGPAAPEAEHVSSARGSTAEERWGPNERWADKRWASDRWRDGAWSAEDPAAGGWGGGAWDERGSAQDKWKWEDADDSWQRGAWPYSF